MFLLLTGELFREGCPVSPPDPMVQKKQDAIRTFAYVFMADLFFAISGEERL